MRISIEEASPKHLLIIITKNWLYQFNYETMPGGPAPSFIPRSNIFLSNWKHRSRKIEPPGSPSPCSTGLHPDNAIMASLPEGNLSSEKAELRKWSEHINGIDTRDSINHDLVIHIHKLKVKDAVDMICHAARLEQFQATPESQRAIDDLALAGQTKAVLMDVKADLRVSAQDGTILIKTEAPMLKFEALAQQIEEIAKTVPGVREARVELIPRGAENRG
jgi:hypothetical protein